jgi:hypothetical protein
MRVSVLYNASALWIAERLLVAGLIPMLMFSRQMSGQDDKDPHRPDCTSAQCRKIKSFLKARYCGESPAGNGPDDGCEIRSPKKLATGIEVKADFDCRWIEGVQKCEQHGEPTPEIRSMLIGQLQGLGLPVKAAGAIHFKLWESTASGWSLAEAYYDHSSGDNLTICQVIAIIDKSWRVHVLRKVPYQQTDVDTAAVTTWSAIDLADVDGDGSVDVILEGDAYEDHWLEVDDVEDGSSRTIFSGLGYYL